MIIFNSYVKLPDGILRNWWWNPWSLGLQPMVPLLQKTSDITVTLTVNRLANSHVSSLVDVDMISWLSSESQKRCLFRTSSYVNIVLPWLISCISLDRWFVHIHPMICLCYPCVVMFYPSFIHIHIIYLSTYRSIYLSVYRSIYRSIDLSIDLYINI